MVASVGDIMLKKDSLKQQLENMLVQYVFPFFQNPNGYLRARACCVLRMFSEVEFQNENNLFQAYQAVYRCLLNDDQLPVKGRKNPILFPLSFFFISLLIHNFFFFFC